MRTNIRIMGDSIVGHAYHEHNHIVEDVEWSHTHEEVKSIEITTTNAL